MSNKEITQEDIDRLVEDASYLQDEAEAMKYVIEGVPYSETPPGKRSIVEMLLLIDHAQLSYFRPILEEAWKNPRPTRLDQYNSFEDTFELDEEKAADIQKVLNKIIKHRAGLINVIKNIPLIDWETTIYDGEKDITLYHFMLQMITYERRKLKEIADLVMIFNQEKQHRKELKQRQKDRS